MSKPLFESDVIDYGDISVVFGDGWVEITQRGNSNACVPAMVLQDIVSEYKIREHSRKGQKDD